MNLLILLSISFLLLSITSLFSQNNVITINVNPLNRLRISFDKAPAKYTSELSDDKKAISININEPFQQIDTIINFQGIIAKTKINADAERCSIVIELNDKRGYTIASLPYSNTLMIDVFQWNSLTNGEDKFRTALIALESNLKESAYNDLIEAVRENTKDAASILGLELIKAAYIESSKLLFDYASFKNDTSVYEVFAALSDIYNSKNDISKSNSYSAKYLNVANSHKLSFLLGSYKNPNDSVFLIKIKFIDSLMKLNIVADTNKVTKVDSTIIAIKDTAIKNDSLYSYVVEYAIYFLLALLLLIIYFYAKWRSKKIQEIIESKKIKVPEAKEKKIKSESIKQNISSKLANVYKKQEVKDEITEAPKIEKSEAQRVTEQNKKATDLLDIVKKVQDENKRKDISEKNLSNVIETKHRSQIPAKVEIAMNIAQEQKKFKEHSLEEFNALSLPTETDKLFEISKKLGIEMGGFEIRKQIEKIMKNDKEMEELKNKFTNRTE